MNVTRSLDNRSFTTAGPLLWNNVFLQLRDSELSLLEFRRLLKTHLFCWGPRRRVAVAFALHLSCVRRVSCSCWIGFIDQRRNGAVCNIDRALPTRCRPQSQVPNRVILNLVQAIILSHVVSSSLTVCDPRCSGLRASVDVTMSW